MTPRVIQMVGLIVAFLLAGIRSSTASSGEVLTDAAEVLSLTAERAKQQISISITGVVTASEPNWNGRFFMQDASGGVFVINTNGVQPRPGDLVHVWGISHPGGYAPDITQPHWTKLGVSRLPDAKPISVEQLMSGAEDGQRVEVSGIVRFAQAGTTRLALELASGRYRFEAFPPLSPSIDPNTLLGATVRLRGTAAASFNAPLRHILTVVMFIPQPADFIIDQLPGPGVFLEPVTPLDGIAQYRRNRTPATRIRVRGVVTYQRLGEDLFLQDATGGLQVKCGETNRLAPGEVVEAIGFPDVEGFLPVLQNATLIRTPESRQPIIPRRVSFQELSEGRHHSELITLQGKLLDSSFRRGGPPARRPNGIRTILTLQNSDFSFTAEAPPAKGAADSAAIPLGSTLEVSGICELQVGKKGTLQALNLLIPSARDIRVLQKPGWWTPGRLLTGLAVLLGILMVAITWTIMILRRNAALRTSLAEKAIAQRELQQAHDLLESRVQERTRQLKCEMTARKEAEVRFKATLTERTRLAQELHDTLEQSMTGIGLQLEAAGHLFDTQPSRASHHVELARNLMTQSQVELRRSIWDLRSRELEEFDLRNALLESGRRMTEGTGIQFRVLTEGTARPLPEVVEENLLRMGQEALTNLIKHSGAKTATIALVFGSQSVLLSIKDDGKGFTPGNCAGPQQGHFGLAGIGERTKRLGGKVFVQSAPGAGTCIKVEIPIRAEPAAEEPVPGNGPEPI
jgi:signal transduction histidine kinase